MVVHTRDGRSLRGVLVGAHRDALGLAHAAVLSEDGGQVSAAGEILVPRDNVSFVQVVDA